MPTRNRLVTIAVVALSSAAVTGPALAATGPLDRRSPDAIDAAATPRPAAVHDLRSPDAIDAAATPRPAAVQDLRSPDAADFARSDTTQRPPAPAAGTVPAQSSGLDWGSAAIGAGGTVGLLAVALGSGLALRRRHATVPGPVIPR